MKWLDIAKGIAILAVVFGHVSIIDWAPYRRILFSFHMPLFFIAAGYTTKAEWHTGSVKKAFLRLLVPYIAASAVAGAVYLIRGSDLQTELLRMFWGSGVRASYGPGRPITGAESIPASGAVWFLPCMFFSKLLFSAFLIGTKRWPEWKKGAAVLLICGCGYLIGQRYKLPLGIDIALFNIVFFYAGYLLRAYHGMSRKSVVYGAVLLILWYLALRLNALEISARYYRDFPACIFTTLGAIAACYLIFHASEEVIGKIRGISSVLTFCGEHSLTILLIHYFDGILWSYSWFVGWLPDCSRLPNLVQGCMIALCKTVLYLIICWAYCCGKKWIVWFIKKKSNTLPA